MYLMIIFLICLGTASIIYNYKTIDKYKYEMYKSQLDLSLAVAFYRNDNFKSPKQHFQSAIKQQFQTVID